MPKTPQPETIRVNETGFDALEMIPVGDHLNLLQRTEDGESETVVIGPEQQRELLKVLQQMLGGR